MTTQKSSPKSKSKSKSKPNSAPAPSPTTIPNDIHFKTFQSNLLSLISHELRTPLTGILNALTLLEDREMASEFSETELIAMARKSADRLHMTLGSLLDLAALDTGTFYAKLREVSLPRLVKKRIENSFSHRINLEETDIGIAIVADPQKITRAVDLLMELVRSWSQADSRIQLRLQSSRVELQFVLASGHADEWQSAVEQMSSFHPEFGSILKSEQEFLSRKVEGLGSNFYILREIMKAHEGNFEVTLREAMGLFEVTLILQFQELSSIEGVRAAIASRTKQVSNEIGSVVICIFKAPDEMDIEIFRAEVKRGLFRASDAVYSLPDQGQLVMVMDDCKPEDVPGLVERISRNVGRDLGYGMASAPKEGFDPEELLKLARSRMSSVQHKK